MQTTTILKMTTLTPVHIGTGEWLQPEFELLPFPEEGCLAVVDTEKILDIVGEEGLSDWISVIEKQEPLLDWLQTRYSSSLEAKDVGQRIIQVEGEIPTKSKVKAQLRLASPATACIPGSSVKGSIRTVIFNDQVKHMMGFTNDSRRLLDKGRRDLNFSDRQVNAEIFGRKTKENFRKGGYDLDANRDFMRIIRFSDFYFPGTTVCHRVEIINKDRDSWGVKEKETSYAECIPADEESTGRFQVPQQLLKQIEKYRFQKPEYKTDRIKRNKHYANLEVLFALINDFTENLVEKEIKFWEEEDNPSVIGNYLEHLREVTNHIRKAREGNACVLRVGAGSGWTFMTGAWVKNEKLITDDTWYDIREKIQRRDYPDAVPTPKTRNLLGGGMPLGFVKLNIQ